MEVSTNKIDSILNQLQGWKPEELEELVKAMQAVLGQIYRSQKQLAKKSMKTEKQIRLEVIEEMKRRLWNLYCKEVNDTSLDAHVSFDLIQQELIEMKSEFSKE